MKVLIRKKFMVRAMIVQLLHLPQSVRVPREPHLGTSKPERIKKHSDEWPQKHWE
jgi:hypothetical protein